MISETGSLRNSDYRPLSIYKHMGHSELDPTCVTHDVAYVRVGLLELELVLELVPALVLELVRHTCACGCSMDACACACSM